MTAEVVHPALRVIKLNHHGISMKLCCVLHITDESTKDQVSDPASLIKHLADILPELKSSAHEASSLSDAIVKHTVR